MSQPSKDTTSRRSFLRHTAVMLTAAPVAAFGATAMVKPVEIIDPIFAVIDLHKAAHDALEAAVSHNSRLEEEIDRSLRQSGHDWDLGGLRIVEGDDPRWIASERAVESAIEAENEAAIAFVDTQPTTLAGVIAALTYAVDFTDRNSDVFGGGRFVDDEDPREREADWSFFLHRTLARALKRIVAEGRSA